MKKYDVTIIGGGPAGLAAALSAHEKGARVLLVEREEKLGGILKKCIHDGFGLIRFKEKLSGPEYVKRYIDEVEKLPIDVMTWTFLTHGEKTAEGFNLTLVSRDGVETIDTATVILATGCRERTAKQVKIHGTRPAGVLTAGTAQALVNLKGLNITKKCVILGSGDIGLIMARRLTLEGAEVLGVYEVLPEPSGLSRNIAQCLDDYNIPLHLSHTVTRVFGHDRLEAVEISKVDDKLNPIPGTEEIIECDSLILSVGLIPENEIAEKFGVQIDPATRGPLCDKKYMTSVPGIFAAGNCHHVYDLVDYVSENGRQAGYAAAAFAEKKKDTVTMEMVEIGENGSIDETNVANDEDNGKWQPVSTPPNKKEHINYSPDNPNVKEMTCIVCPNGCHLKVERKDGEWIVEGNTCPKGKDFAIEEMTDPKRTICALVPTTFEDEPVAAVRLTDAVQKARIFDVMKEINGVILKEPMKAGDIVIKDVCGLGADVILENDVQQKA